MQVLATSSPSLVSYKLTAIASLSIDNQDRKGSGHNLYMFPVAYGSPITDHVTAHAHSPSTLKVCKTCGLGARSAHFSPGRHRYRSLGGDHNQVVADPISSKPVVPAFEGAATTTNSDSNKRHSITRNADLDSGSEWLQKENWSTQGLWRSRSNKAPRGAGSSRKFTRKHTSGCHGLRDVPYQADGNGRAKNPPRAEYPFTIKVDPDI
ncbi:uncharacterized protein J3D65DRAFT_62244 [Phyllosticta citribraziliensis]|uniref:Uncharacterized protein n=1 Tax=Phyllosticta citribraziliensis TaxID=989973 RepID=A0ABR1LCI9_9PEZI